MRRAERAGHQGAARSDFERSRGRLGWRVIKVVAAPLEDNLRLALAHARGDWTAILLNPVVLLAGVALIVRMRKNFASSDVVR